jgi:hypothetical protein
VHLAPALGLADDRRGLFERDPLGAPCAGPLLEVTRPSKRLPADLLARPRALQPTRPRRALGPLALPLRDGALHRAQEGRAHRPAKTDVDLTNRLLTVTRSYRRDTTKGGHADVIPIATELVPFLENAIASSPSDLVFPAPDGSIIQRACSSSSCCAARSTVRGSSTPGCTSAGAGDARSSSRPRTTSCDAAHAAR